MNVEATFVDTWGWMALGHRRDANHGGVSEVFRLLRSNRIPVYTSDFVLDELITLLFRREFYDQAVQFVETLLSAAEVGQLTVDRVTSGRFVA